MAQLQLIKQNSGILIAATPETSDILQSKIKLGAVLVAEFKQVRNPAFHRRFFALLNLGFEYWEPAGGAISSNERKLVTGYAKYLSAYGGNEGALLDAAEQYLEQIAALTRWWMPVPRKQLSNTGRFYDVKKPAICLFLLMSLVGCSTTRTVYVPAQCAPIPGTLTQPVIAPLPPER